MVQKSLEARVDALEDALEQLRNLRRELRKSVCVGVSGAAWLEKATGLGEVVQQREVVALLPVMRRIEVRERVQADKLRRLGQSSCRSPCASFRCS